MTQNSSDEAFYKRVQASHAYNDKVNADERFYQATKDFHASLSLEDKKRILKVLGLYNEGIGKITATQWENPKEAAWMFGIAHTWLTERRDNVLKLAKAGDTKSIISQHWHDKINERLPQK